MKVSQCADFRNNLWEYLNLVNQDKEILIVSRRKGKNIVVMDLDEYNSLQETLHLMSNHTNRIRLEDAITEMKNDQSQRHTLI